MSDSKKPVKPVSGHSVDSDKVESTDQKPAQVSQETARRNILRGLIAGGSLGAGSTMLPSSWTRPVVGSVILPAHAQGSAVGFNGTGVVGGNQIPDNNPVQQDFQFAEFIDSVRSTIISDAAAGMQVYIHPFPLFFCLAIRVGNLNNPGSTATVELTSNAPFGPNDGTGTLAELKSSGIMTSLGNVVIATSLTAGGGGSGTVDGIAYTLTPGSCEPADRGEGTIGL